MPQNSTRFAGFADFPYVFRLDDAIELGVNEAILWYVLGETLHRAVDYSHMFPAAIEHAGTLWLPITDADWRHRFPFWPVSTSKRTLTSLARQQVLMTAKLTKSASTIWYSHPEAVIPPPRIREPKPNKKRLAVFARDNHQCRSCGSTEHLTVDHIVPRSKGGTHHLDNLQTLCRSCNSRKGART